MPIKKNTAVVQPNLGIFYDRAKIALSPRMLQDGLNFRIKLGLLSNLNMGWDRFGTFTLNGPVVDFASFTLTGGSEKLVFATYTDLYQYIDSATVRYITPRYETGTAARSGNTVTGSGTSWLTNAKIGDQILFGTAGVVSTSATWDTITNVGGDTTITTTGSGTVGSGPYTIRRLFTGGQADIWQHDVFVNASPSAVNELWMTNGKDTIVRWNGSATQVEQMSASLGFTAKTLRVFDNMMLFANVVQSGTSKPSDLINSDVGQPQNAGSASTGLSNQFKAHGGIEQILRMEVIGDNLAIYSNLNRITLIAFVGDPLIFIFRQISSTIGIISSNAVANFGNYHEFLSPTTQYYFDGATIKPVNSHVWRELLRQQDPSRIKISFAIFDQQNADLIWVIPTTGDTTVAPSIASVEHYLEETGATATTSPYSRRSFPFTSVGFFKRQQGLTWDQISSQWQNTNFRWNDQFFLASFPLILVGDLNGKIYTLNTGQNADGVALPSFVTFGRRALGDGHIRGLLARVYPFVSVLSTPVDVTVQMSDSANGTPMIIDTKSFDQTQPEGGHFTIHYRRGRYFELKFSSSALNRPWEVAGYDTNVRPGGHR